MADSMQSKRLLSRTASELPFGFMVQRQSREQWQKTISRVWLAMLQSDHDRPLAIYIPALLSGAALRRLIQSPNTVLDYEYRRALREFDFPPQRWFLSL